METRVGFGPRLLAALIDFGIVAVVGFVAGATIGGLLGSAVGSALGGASAEGVSDGAAVGAAVGAVLGAVGALGGFVFLYSLIEAFTGASPGKMALGLKVGLEDGRRAGTGVYARRWAIKYSSTLLGLLAALPGLHVVGLIAPVAGLIVLAGCFLVLGDKRQALHDVAARTAVFRKIDLVP